MSQTLENVLFISMNGETKEAIEFYKKHFEAEVEMIVTYEDIAKRMPEFRLTEENRHFISHSVLRIGKSKLMMAEDKMNPNQDYQRGNNFSMCIQSADLEEIRAFYASVITDSRTKVIQPLGPNVFSKAYGIIEDPYKIQIQLMYDPRLI